MIQTENLSKIYQTGAISVRALDGVSFNIRKGEFAAIMGASGSGKSTLMNLLGLLDHPSSGSYCLDGIEVSALSDKDYAYLRNQKIGFVFQSFHLLPRLTALKNVELPMLYAGVKPAARRERAIQALERLGLGNRLHHRPNELSGGQNQRVAIARALCNNPAIILADEPTGALDSQSSLEIMDIFQQLNREGVTIVLVTHEADIARHSQRIIRLRDGRLVADEKVADPIIASHALTGRLADKEGISL